MAVAAHCSLSGSEAGLGPMICTGEGEGEGATACALGAATFGRAAGARRSVAQT